MADFDVFPDIEALVINKINALGVTEAFDAIPAQNRPDEFAMVHRDGGGVLKRHRWEQPSVHIDVYAASKGRARLLAHTIRKKLMDEEGKI